MKKILASALAAFMLASSIPSMAAFQFTGEQAISVAKTLLPIPDELTEFSYDMDEYSCYMSWEEKDGSRHASASVNKYGVVTDFYCSTDSSYRTLAAYSKEQAEEAARAFLKAVIPDLEGKLQVTSSSVSSVTFERYENGIPVANNTASVNINKKDCSVYSYSLDWDFENEFTEGTVISNEDALQALSEKALELIYNPFYNETVIAKYINENFANAVAFPVYTTNGNYILAENGEAFAPSYYNIYGSMKNAYMTEAADDAGTGSGGGSYRLTEQEQLAVDEMESLISKEDAIDKIKALTELELPEEFTASISYYTQRSNDKKTYYANLNCTWENGSARVRLDGKTGELMSFNSYTDSEEFKEKLPNDRLNSIADSFMDKIKDMTDYTSEDSEASSYYFTKYYTKEIDGIPFPRCNRWLEINPRSGRITHFSDNTFEGEVHTPASMVTPLEAAKNNYTADLIYTYNSENKPVLAYMLTASVPNTSYVRAEDGKAVNYSGTEVVIGDTAEKTPEPDHWAWTAYSLFAENDLAPTGSYMLDDFVTTADFEKILLNAVRYTDGGYYWDYDKDEDADAVTVTRELAANKIAEAMNWSKIKDLDIYKTSFADENDFGGSIGAAAILQGLGIMQGTNGYFYPAKNMTYGEAYTVAYNLIKAYEK